MTRTVITALILFAAAGTAHAQRTVTSREKGLGVGGWGLGERHDEGGWGLVGTG